MRYADSLITDIRKQVFTEVARMAYSGDYTQMEDIPYKIVPGVNPRHRESVFLERAIAGEPGAAGNGTVAPARAAADDAERGHGSRGHRRAVL